MGETTLISINARRMEATVTAPAPPPPLVSWILRWEGAAAALEARAEHRKQLASGWGSQASLAGARMLTSGSWRCTGCPTCSTPSMAFVWHCLGLIWQPHTHTHAHS